MKSLVKKPENLLSYLVLVNDFTNPERTEYGYTSFNELEEAKAYVDKKVSESHAWACVIDLADARTRVYETHSNTV